MPHYQDESLFLHLDKRQDTFTVLEQSFIDNYLYSNIPVVDLSLKEYVPNNFTALGYFEWNDDNLRVLFNVVEAEVFELVEKGYKEVESTALSHGSGEVPILVYSNGEYFDAVMNMTSGLGASSSNIEVIYEITLLN